MDRRQDLSVLNDEEKINDEEEGEYDEIEL
jgi:hypothetical protein